MALAGEPSPRAGTLHGSLDHSGQARLRIHYRTAHHENVRWYRWRFTDVRLKCKRGHRTYRFAVTGGEGIWNKFADRDGFGGNTSESGPGGNERVHVDGDLMGPNMAKGHVRVSGSHVALRSGRYDKCDSGRLRWTVKR